MITSANPLNRTIIDIKRAEFFESLETYISLSNSSGKMMSLILIDIENFDQTAQDFGYKTSETFFQAVYTKIEVLAKFVNCVFRLGESTIGLILPVIENKNMLVLAANKILEELKDTLECDGLPIKAILRIGMAVNEEKSVKSEALFKHANQFLNAARKQHKSFLINSMEFDHLDEIENFAEKFTYALNNSLFELYYQPKTHLGSGKHRHAEALLRWKLDGDTYISPEDIIRHAEKSIEHNFNLTKWVINSALRQLKAWLDQDQNISISINISASLIHRKDVVTMISDSLNIWSVPPERLTLEITETAFMTNKEQSHENLNRIRDLGVALSIDDFGTGYSSLSYFKDIPAQELKIDKSFIFNLLESSENKVLVILMIKIAHAFSLKVVAEGVETAACYDHLKELGCDYAQGYYIAKPKPASEFLEWLQENQSLAN